MASFPVYQPVGSPNLPDPKSMVVDWSGAVDKAINGFVEARKLGMQERYYNHLISQGEQREKRERDEFNWKMEQDKIKNADDADRLAVYKSNAAVERSMNTAQRIHAETRNEVEKANLFNLQRENNAVTDYSNMTQEEDYNRGLRASQSYHTILDPLARSMAAEEGMKFDEMYGGKRSSLVAANPKLANVVPGLFSDAKMKADSAKVYDTGEPEYEIVETARDPSIEGVAKAAESEVDISGIGPQRSRQVKATGRNKMISYNDMMAGVQAGDPTALKTFFKYSSDPAKAEEMLKKKASYLMDAPPDSVAKIKLGKAALAARDSRLVGGAMDVAGPREYDVLNNMKKDMENGTLDEELAPAVVPARTSSGAVIEGKFVKIPRTVGTRPMTKRDVYMQQVDELRPDVNPAGINMIMEELAVYDAKRMAAQDKKVASTPAPSEPIKKPASSLVETKEIETLSKLWKQSEEISRRDIPFEERKAMLEKQKQSARDRVAREREYIERTNSGYLGTMEKIGMKLYPPLTQEELARPVPGKTIPELYRSTVRTVGNVLDATIENVLNE
jgi:hypothetical protein